MLLNFARDLRQLNSLVIAGHHFKATDKFLDYFFDCRANMEPGFVELDKCLAAEEDLDTFSKGVPVIRCLVKEFGYICRKPVAFLTDPKAPAQTKGQVSSD